MRVWWECTRVMALLFVKQALLQLVIMAQLCLCSSASLSYNTALFEYTTSQVTLNGMSIKNPRIMHWSRLYFLNSNADCLLLGIKHTVCT
jgi:hypothetical protein